MEPPYFDEKRDRVAYSATLLNSRCMNILTQGVLMNLAVFYFEPLRKAMNKASVPKGRDVPQIARQYRSKKKVFYTHKILLKGHCATETTQGRKEHQGGVLQRLFFRN